MRIDLARELLRDMSARVPGDLIAFGRALEAAGGNVDGWPYFLERSEKWADEYTAWVNADKPTDDSSWLPAVGEDSPEMSAGGGRGEENNP